jgi:bifunctional DNase/RNase
MKKIELKIFGLSYSHTQAGSYVLVLSELIGNLKLPIIIKPGDAQYIAMKTEGLSANRPVIHDLVKMITDQVGVDLHQIYISHILEGVFYCKLIFDSNGEDIEIECSVGDGVCLALSYGCPILCSEEVLKLSGINISDDGTTSEEQMELNRKERDYKATSTVDDLEKRLSQAIDNEEYEIASQIRDRIKELKKT